MRNGMRSATLLFTLAVLVSTASALGADSAAGSCVPIPFQSAISYPTNVQIDSLLAGDFNGDGIADIAASSFQDDEVVVVLLQNADGSFQPPIATPVPNGEAISAGYFNDDSYLDLVVGYSTLYVLMGNGDGTFQPPVPLDLGVNVQGQRPMVADFNGDGKADIGAVSLSNPSELLIALGNGDGTFQAAISSPTGLGSMFVSGAVIGDLNQDGKPDVVVSGYPPTAAIMVLLGVGDGHFQDPLPVAFDGSPTAMVIADVTGDGNADLIAASGDLFVFAGDGAGHLAAPTDVPRVPGVFPVSLAVIGGSPEKAIAVAAESGVSPLGYVLILHGDGNGSLTLDQAYAGGSAPIVAAAFGGSSLGLAVPSADLREVSVLYGRPNGEFAGAPASAIDVPTPLSMTSGDFNEDGFPDLVAGTYGDSSTNPDFFVLLGTGDGQFTPGYTDSFSERIESLTAGDFNEDGHLDLLVLGEGDGLFLLFGNGDGTFGARTPLFGMSQSSVPVVTRFNAQSHLDLILTAYDFNGQPYIVSFIGHGDGTFTQVATTESLANYPGSMTTGDFNGDGNADFAYTANDNSLRIKLGNGDGTFGAETIYETGSLSSLSVADVDSDGHLDLLAASGDGTLSVFYGAGDGSFGSVTYGVGWPGAVVASADFGGDGIPDLVTSTGNSGIVAFLRGLGQRRFDSPQVVPAGPQPTLLAVADLNADGRPDVAISSAPGFVALLSVARSALLSDASAVVGSAAQLLAEASGFGALSYQWRKGGVPLSDGGSISGSTTGTLTINPVSFADAGSYDVVVTDSCGSTTSNPATLSVEFADVPISSPFHDDILAIATAGITSGCGGGNYCPSSPVRRDQMAAFLLKSEHGSAYLPPPCTGVFADVPCPSTFANWIEQLAAESVTSGCGNGNYCPASSVTRAQMAVFLLKTKNGSSYVPPPATGIFGDVPVGSFAADYIEALYNLHVSGGCQSSPLLYCPDNPVLRQQMAALLLRTFFQ